MTPAERAAVHALAGAFGRLSLAAELVALTPPGRARAAMVDRMECARKLALAEFSAAQNVLAAEARTPEPPPPEMSSATPKALPQPPPAAAPSPPPRAEQTPAASTTQPVAPGAGGGRAVSPRPAIPSGSKQSAAALLWAQHGSFTAAELAEAGGFRLLSLRTTLCELRDKGFLRFVPPLKRGTREAGYYESAVSVEVLREAQERAGKRDRSAAARAGHAARRTPPPTYARSGAKRASTPAAEPLTAERLALYGARRVPVEQALTSSPRPSQAQRVADWLAHKEPLPPARPPVFLERGSRHT